MVVRTLRQFGGVKNIRVKLSERVGLIAVRHIDQVLSIKVAVLIRADSLVCHVVVDVISAHRAGVGKIYKLQWRRTQRTDAIAIARRVSVEVDQDVNSVGRNLLSALLVVLVCAEVFEVLHPEPQSLPIFRVVLA